MVGIFFEAERLQNGSAVRVAGYALGVVTKIELLPPDGDSVPPFAATIQLPSWIRSRIRHDSRIRLERPRPMGDPVVELTPGTPESPIVQPGDTLYARPPLRTATIVELAGELRGAIDSLLADERVLRERSRPLAARRARLERELTAIHGDLLAFEQKLRVSPLAEFLADTTSRATLVRIGAQAGEIGELARARSATLSDTLYRPVLESIAGRATALHEEIGRLRELLEAPLGFPTRWEEDPALRNAIEVTRARLDSLIELTRRKPWRYFF
jgi:hypothetical protein